MAQVQRQDERRDVQARGDKPEEAAAKKAPPASRQQEVEEKARRLIGDQRYEEALNLLRSCGANDNLLLNARGVCLMRAARVDEAVKVFRSFVLQPGGTWMKKDLPLVYKINFATALLMSNLVEGCLETLSEIDREDHPSVARLRAAIRRWESELSLWQKLNWWTRVVPNHPVTIDFVPGEFPGEFQADLSLRQSPGGPIKSS